MRKINHIFIILFLTILFLFSVYFIKFLRENVFFFLISLLIINLIIYFFVNLPNKKYDISLILFLLISIIASRLIFNNLDQSTLILRTSSILSFFILHLILLIGPWSKFSDSIIKIYHFRRHLGVTVFFLGTLHVVIILPRYFSYSIKGALSSIFIFYGLTSFFLLFWLAITSWDHLQKKVKDMTWKAIHLILLLIYISLSYYMYTIQKTFNESTLNYHLIVIGIFILIWIIIAPYSFIKKIMSTKIGLEPNELINLVEVFCETELIIFLIIFTTLLNKEFWLSTHKVWICNGLSGNVVIFSFTTCLNENGVQD